MRRYLYLMTIGFLFMVWQNSWATTYFKNWVNGAVSNVMVQGDFYAWEYDLSVVGGSAHIQIYTDTNGDQLLDGNDVLLFEFDQKDGESGEGAPSDSSAIPDGIIYSDLGPFGFAPGDYLFVVEDMDDHSTVTGVLHINAPALVSVWISGQVTMEGVTPPDDRLAWLMMEAGVDSEEEGGFWSGLTDEYGNFTINLPDDAVNNDWKISFMFGNQLAGYVPDPESYHQVSVQTGENSGFDFYLQPPKAWVYGDIIDENGQLVVVSGWGWLENLNSGQETEFIPTDGHFKVGAAFEDPDTIDVPFRLNFWSETLVPDYLMPESWENPDYEFNLSAGDSIQKNIQVWSTDTVIYVVGIKDSVLLSSPYEAWATNQTVGRTFTALNGQLERLYVRSGYEYYINLSNTEYGELIPPSGYYLEGGNYRMAFPGDTVRFVFLPAQNQLSGRIYFEPGDPVGNLEECGVHAFTEDWGKFYDGTIDRDSMTYTIYVPADTFNVRFECWNGDYLTMPAQFEHIVADTGNVDTLDFMLNYAHANLVVKLINAPVSDPESIWMYISTIGQYPYVYDRNQGMEPDSTFYFRVCEGEWWISAPYFGENFLPDKQDTLVLVTEGQTDYYVEFNYTDLTGIEENKEQIPETFFVEQNYPNPFNPATTIAFGLPKQQPVKVEIYNVVGQKIATLLDGTLPAGIHHFKWDGTNFSSGMYFYRVTTPEKTIIHRMLLLK